MKIWIYLVSGFFSGILAVGLSLFYYGQSLENRDSETIRFFRYSPLAISQVEQVPFRELNASNLLPEKIEEFTIGLIAQTQNPDSCLQLVVDGYTKGLLAHWRGKTNHPDSTYRLLHWAEQIKSYSPENKELKLAFDAIGGFWLDHIARELGTMAISNPELKYSYSFRYQVDRCAFHHFMVNAPMTLFEKGLNQLFESRIGYIANRIALDFSHFQLGLLTLAIAITLAGWIFVLKIIFIRMRNIGPAQRRKVDL